MVEATGVTRLRAGRDGFCGYPPAVTTKRQPPVDGDEARFDDEGSAIGRPEPGDTDETDTGGEAPSPKRDDAFGRQIKAARWKNR